MEYERVVEFNNGEINPELALKLLIEGGTFILQNAPEGMEFGIDMKCWSLGSKFKGVKMIPPGPHYVYYSETSDSNNMMSRKGFIHVFKEKEFLVKCWDPLTKNINTDEISKDEVDRLRSNLLQLDQFLGPYPYDVWDKWKPLSNHITENLVNSLTPKCKFIQVAVETVVSANAKKKKRWIKPRTEEERQEDLLPDIVPVEGTEIRFTELPEERHPKGATPSQITAHYLDVTYTLHKMLNFYESPLEFIGEIQFAFVCTLIGLNLEAFERWKRLIQLVCSCERAILQHTQMYSEFITSLSAQLDEIPIDFLVDIVANDNVIYSSLRDFFRTLDIIKETVDPALMRKAEQFKNKLTERFEWEFNNLQEDPEDEAPVVVEDV